MANSFRAKFENTYTKLVIIHNICATVLSTPVFALTLAWHKGSIAVKSFVFNMSLKND